jgi:hypothetical protein
MIKIIRTYERPLADIPFYHEIRKDNQLIQKHMYENYISTKKFVAHNQTMSEDKLKYIMSVTWVNIDAFFDFITDVTFARLIDPETSKKYEDDHGITMTINIEEVNA